MTPQLPADDLKVIEEFRFKMMELLKESETNFAHWRIEPYKLWDLIQIISRLQLALDECIRQRDEEMQYNPMSKSTKEMWKDRKNNQIKEILEGEK